MSSRFGTLLNVSTFGESHCKGVGSILDGCPPGMPLDESDIQPQLDRRRPGQSRLTTDRQEADQVTIFSGVENGLTLGTPIGLIVYNKDQRPGDYREMSKIPRPSHADYTYQMKYGIRASSGGGRASARETIGRVAAGAVAEKILRLGCGIEIVAWVSAVNTIAAAEADVHTITRDMVDTNPVRCPDPDAARRMEALVAQVKEEKDSVGGIVTCVCRNVPAGWGEPVFDKLEARLAQAMLSIPATKGFEIGSGFAGTRLRGSAHNDPFRAAEGRLGTVTNNSGGIQGGIANGEPIVFRVAFKPPATIGLPQKTVDFDGNPVVLEAKGRHDPCVVPRAVPIVETMAALVLADGALRQKAIMGFDHLRRSRLGGD
ncbi:chorismate synthase [Desulfosarcina ovata]|uniref:Chorismate synthase n=1 Tax=Desulfosarcina ovata subsp. ovata TaxID=2752305 RepID=A0A5K8AD97_9BACT|nr:chorismate synthase [Desulfosarcina ovata]BBO90582.1 chorismate synthase [Desulfosarcina ovata subsp. ovata]